MPKISGLPADTSPLVSDIVPMVDNTAVVTKKVLLSDLITTIFNNAPAVASSGWNTMSQAFTYGANNGNKEFTITTPNDVTGLLWPGMRMKFNRGTMPPTQSMSFTAASSQYASKATPSGITFTSAYTIEGWIDVKSYQTFGTILQRRDSPATGGFGFRVDATGVLTSFYYSGGNLTEYQSRQTIPLNQMVHVATTVVPGSQTVLFYINGLLVPGVALSLNTSSITQTGTLSAGGWADAVSEFFDGYLSEVRLWSNVQTQSQIQANMTKNLVGNEANLVGLWQGNGNFNDLTANANTLTPHGGATSQAINPYSSTEYAIVTNVSYINPTTTITLFTGTDYMIPNMTLASPQYSTVRSPYGFPTARNKWQVYGLFLVQSQINGPGYNSWQQFAGQQLSVPMGEWNLTYSAGVTETASFTSALGIGATLSTTNNSSSDRRFEAYLFHSAGIQLSGQLSGRASVSLTTQTVYYNNVCITSGTTTTLYVNAIPGGTIPQVSYIIAESAYL